MSELPERRQRIYLDEHRDRLYASLDSQDYDLLDRLEFFQSAKREIPPNYIPLDTDGARKALHRLEAAREQVDNDNDRTLIEGMISELEEAGELLARTEAEQLPDHLPPGFKS